MGKAMKIAIVDDEKDMRLSITQWLALSGYDTESFAKAEDALAAIGPDYPCLLYTSPSPRDLSTSRMPSSA